MTGIRLIRAAANLTPPHGGKLVNLLVTTKRALALNQDSVKFVSLYLSQRQQCDLELLISGGFSPLTGFMGKADYEHVCSAMRLTNGMLWPVPITLDVAAAIASNWKMGQRVALYNSHGTMLAVLTVAEIWFPDKEIEARLVFGTNDDSHPEVNYLYKAVGDCYVAGKIEAVQLPTHYDFSEFRHTPAEIRRLFMQRGYKRVIGYYARNPLHRAHVEFIKRAAQLDDAAVLIHAVAGNKRTHEQIHYSHIRAHKAVREFFSPVPTALCLTQLYPRMCGARERIWHAIINKNFGGSHLISEHDYHDYGKHANGEPIYGKYDAQKILGQYETDIGIKMIPFRNLVYEEDRTEQIVTGMAPSGYLANIKNPRDAKDVDVQRRKDIAHWFSYPKVLNELELSNPSRDRQGFTVFFTGLPGAGKSTVADILMVKLLEIGNRVATVIEGKNVGEHSGPKLDNSCEHKDMEVLYLGYAASLITKHQGIAICAAAASCAATRAQIRDMVQKYGEFIEVHVATPLEICELRCRKRLDVSERGAVTNIVDISACFETPINPEISIDMQSITAEIAALKIMNYLADRGLLPERHRPDNMTEIVLVGTTKLPFDHSINKPISNTHQVGNKK